jgi:anthranilate phosphoribosyltransferase
MNSISIADAIQRAVDHRELGHDEMVGVMRRLMRGELTPAQIAGFVIGLRVKRETVGEIAAAAQVMREFATPVRVADDRHLVDTCGTGGDVSHTFNVSTCAAFVAAAAGARVAKHMGRSVSSASGSAEVLEALGARVPTTPEQTGAAIDRIGIGFLFAPAHHAALRHAAPVRKELGVRTLFNILAPLTNPAGAKRQLLGVFDAELVGIQARVLQRLGSEHVLVVHGEDGLDEISISAGTRVGELVQCEVREYRIDPEALGFALADRRAIEVADVEESRAMVLGVLDDRPGPARDIVLLNAGAALYAADVAGSLADGIARARAALASGAARAALDSFVRFTKQGI